MRDVGSVFCSDDFITHALRALKWQDKHSMDTWCARRIMIVRFVVLHVRVGESS